MEHNDDQPGFNRTWETVKHVGKQMLKYAVGVGLVVAAIAGGAYALGAVGLICAPLTLLGGAVDILAGFVGINTGLAAGAAIGTGSSILAVAMTALKGGAILGAGAGALVGISGAEEAVDERAEDARDNYDRLRQREQSASVMAMNLERQKMIMAQQAQQLGLTPNMTNMQLPVGRGPSAGREGGFS